ncbi:MAG TPA: Asp-tRNA(Asn)/Glu-tRNA(Gln) amidotransferase subunit GatC [Vicinamibacterales bacterium]|nr:Asp-tRNA(Asn)/Glu-tRNA(Gln) amidotransferase subunit GatC [Vicinamibacterales bacterium]
MASTLTRADVLRIARLAHLELSEAEVDLFARQLGEILTYAEEVQRVDTTDVAPTSHVIAAGTVWRPDTPVPPLDREAALANAPDASRDAGLFRVPKVL